MSLPTCPQRDCDPASLVHPNHDTQKRPIETSSKFCLEIGKETKENLPRFLISDTSEILSQASLDFILLSF